MGVEIDEMLELTLGVGRDAPARARTAIRGLNGSLAELGHPVRLLVSELVTNAVRHGSIGAGSTVHVRLEALQERVRVEVRDEGPGFDPDHSAAADPSTAGFGLKLVDELTDRWGVSTAGGALVWFEIDR